MTRRKVPQRCRLFGHRWAYGRTMDYPMRVFRTCRHCPIVQELKQVMPMSTRVWVTMVQWSDKGAREELMHHYEKRGGSR